MYVYKNLFPGMCARAYIVHTIDNVEAEAEAEAEAAMYDETWSLHIGLY